MKKMLQKISRLIGRGIAWLWRKMSWKQRLITVSMIVLAIIGLGAWGYFHFKPSSRPPSESHMNLGQIEKICHELVNAERQAHGLQPLKWNADLTAVARGHSQDLARESAPLTQIGCSVNLPLIHHEGFKDQYHSDRLARVGIFYYSASAENIALAPAYRLNWRSFAGDPLVTTVEKHQEICQQMEELFSVALHSDEPYDQKVVMIRKEINARKKLFVQRVAVPDFQLTWDEQSNVCQKTVQGWMSSPGHRKNILTPELDEAGMGASYVNGYVIITQVFIIKANCGYKGGPCCQKEGHLPGCFSGLNCQDGTCR